MTGFSYMRKKMLLRFFCASACVLIVPLHASAEGWLQPKGKKIDIYDISYFSTNDSYDHLGDKQPTNGRFEKWSAQLYSEHGWREWITLLSSSAIERSQVRSAFRDSEYDVRTVSLDIGARLPIKTFEDGVLSGRLLYAFPEQHSQNSAIANFRVDGDGEIGLEGGYRFPLWGRRHYVSGSAAYRKRAGSASNQWVLHMVAGFKVHEKVEVMPELDWTTLASGQLRNSRLDVAGQNDYKQAKASLSLLWRMTEAYSLQIGGTAPFYTRATGAGYTGKVAIWRRF